MTTYPIVIRKKSMLHRQGTKEYHLVLIVNGDKKALVIKRWGKKQAQGQMEVEAFASVEKAIASFDAKDRDKRSGRSGYQHDPARDTTVECADEAEFRKKLGVIYLPNLGANNLEFIAPGADTSNVKDPEVVEYEDVGGGRMVRKGYEPRNKFDDFYTPPPPTVEEQVAENENWGLW